MGMSTTTSSSVKGGSHSKVNSLISGGLAGMLAKTIVAPLDRIKIIYQVTNTRFKLRGVPETVMRIVKTEGVSALWKGNSVMMVRVFPYAGIQFMVFDSLKTYFSPLTPQKTLVAGSTAGAVSTIATYPLDLARARLAVVQGVQGPGAFFSMLRKITVDGKGGLYRGITPTLAGMIPYAGLAFSTNEALRNLCVTRVNGGGEVTTVQKLQCGGFSGLVAQSVVYPLDVARRRMQTAGLVGEGGGLEGKDVGFKGRRARAGIGETLRRVHAEQGLRGLFKGLTLNWFKGPLAFSVSFTAFDFIKLRMEEWEESRDVMVRRMEERIEGLDDNVGETDETIVGATPSRKGTWRPGGTGRDLEGED